MKYNGSVPYDFSGKKFADEDWIYTFIKDNSVSCTLVKINFDDFDSKIEEISPVTCDQGYTFINQGSNKDNPKGIT